MTKDSRISKFAVLWLIPKSFSSIFQYSTIFIIFLLSSCATFNADKYINYQGKVEISYNKEILRSNMLIKYTNNELIIQLYRPLIGTLFEYDIKFNENFIFQENFYCLWRAWHICAFSHTNTPILNKILCVKFS